MILPEHKAERTMRKRLPIPIVLVALLAGAAMTARADSFCDGWEEGYKSGYCYRQASCLSPLVPMCPMQRMGESGFKDGYNRGFLAGRSARS